MPCIQIQTSCSICTNAKESIKAKLGKAIEVLPGKSENWLMVTMQDEMTIYFKGNQTGESAFVKVGVYGDADGRAFNTLTEKICRILNEELGIAPNRIYVQYEATAHWGWNGANF